METVFIYGLTNSKGDLRYVGKTNDIKKRLRKHLQDSKYCNTAGGYKWKYLE
jgi:predicted GIY-YIG superfamily endonuclease